MFRAPPHQKHLDSISYGSGIRNRKISSGCIGTVNYKVSAGRKMRGGAAHPEESPARAAQADEGCDGLSGGGG
jgi:hypothetical protein